MKAFYFIILALMISLPVKGEEEDIAQSVSEALSTDPARGWNLLSAQLNGLVNTLAASRRDHTLGIRSFHVIDESELAISLVRTRPDEKTAPLYFMIPLDENDPTFSKAQIETAFLLICSNLLFDLHHEVHVHLLKDKEERERFRERHALDGQAVVVDMGLKGPLNLGEFVSMEGKLIRDPFLSRAQLAKGFVINLPLWFELIDQRDKEKRELAARYLELLADLVLLGDIPYRRMRPDTIWFLGRSALPPYLSSRLKSMVDRINFEGALAGLLAEFAVLVHGYHWGLQIAQSQSTWIQMLGFAGLMTGFTFAEMKGIALTRKLGLRAAHSCMERLKQTGRGFLDEPWWLIRDH